MEMKIMLTRPEIAKAYSVSERQVQVWEADYSFPVAKIGGRRLYDPIVCRQWHQQFICGGVPAPTQEKVEA